ncbi:MAG: TPM domain-containing protein [Dehalobacterium sp.]
MKRFLRLLAFSLILLGLFIVPAAQGDTVFPPKPTTNIYVQDFADILTPETEAKLLATGRELDQKTTAQLAVVTVNSLEDMTIEDYAIGLFRNWGIGNKEKNNGVLLLIAPTERQSRIEVGYGLEGALPDGKTGRIQDDYLLPKFQAGDFNGGTVDCYLVLASIIANEYQVELSGDASVPVAPASENIPVKLPTWLVVLIALGVIFLIYLDFRFLGGMITWALLNSLRRGGGGGGGGGFGGGSSGGGGSSRRW